MSGWFKVDERRSASGYTMPPSPASLFALFLIQGKLSEAIILNNTITDGGVAPRCNFAGPT